jgi:hypothetical protein
MLGFLVDNINAVFEDQVFQQSAGIPMGTNCAPLLADLFFYSYQAEFVQKLLRHNNKKLAELEIEDTTESEFEGNQSTHAW